MSDQSEREAYNEAAREDHEGREREAMDRPMFTQRDMDAAVQGEREACAMALSAKSDDMHRLRATKDNRGQESAILLGGAIAYADAAEIIRSRGTSPAVDVMGVVREYVEAVRYKGPGCVDRFIVARDALVALVAASPKAEKCPECNGHGIVQTSDNGAMQVYDDCPKCAPKAATDTQDGGDHA